MKPHRGKIINRMTALRLWGPQDLARHADISAATARKIIAGKTVTISIAIKVAHALEVDLADVFAEVEK